MPASTRQPARQRQVLTFDAFQAGEFGSEAPWRAPKGSYTGLNVQRYVDGSLGPRNGLKQLTLSGAAITGTLAGFGRLFQGNDAPMFALIGTAGYRITTAGVVTALTGALDAAPTEPPQAAFVGVGTKTYISSAGDNLYRIDFLADTLTKIATPNSPGARCFVQYGERTLAAGGSAVVAPDGTAGSPNRIYFSAAANPESWPAANFIDVGDGSNDITGLYPQRTHLVITTSDGSWWILTGVPGVNPVLRKQATSVAPAFPHHAAQLGNGNVAYTIASSGDTGSTASLGLFTGSQLVLNETINYGNGRRTQPYPTYTVVPLKNPADWLVQGGSAVAANRAAVFQARGWALHEWQVAGVTLQGYCASDTVGDRHFFTDGGAPATTPKFYEWRSYNNRPGFSGDTLMQPGDASTTPFTARFSLPEWYAPDGREVGLVEVVVDYTTWNTGSASTNHFDITPQVLRTYESGSVGGSTLSFDEAGAASSTAIAGTRKRKRFSWGGLPEGNGFSLDFAALRGCAISKIAVHIEYDGPRF